MKIISSGKGNTNDLGVEPLGKLLIRYSIPAIIATSVVLSLRRDAGKRAREALTEGGNA